MRSILGILCFFKLVSLASCSNSSINDIKWIEGEWRNNLIGGVELEYWKFEGDTIYGVSSPKAHLILCFLKPSISVRKNWYFATFKGSFLN